MTEITLPTFKVELWNKQRRDGPKEYNTKRSELSRITSETNRIFRIQRRFNM